MSGSNDISLFDLAEFTDSKSRRVAALGEVEWSHSRRSSARADARRQTIRRSSPGDSDEHSMADNREL